MRTQTKKLTQTSAHKGRANGQHIDRVCTLGHTNWLQLTFGSIFNKIRYFSSSNQIFCFQRVYSTVFLETIYVYFVVSANVSMCAHFSCSPLFFYSGLTTQFGGSWYASPAMHAKIRLTKVDCSLLMFAECCMWLFVRKHCTHTSCRDIATYHECIQPDPQRA